MKIKMKSLYAGPNGVMESGREYDVPPAVANELIAGRYAVAVSAVVVPVIETTAAPVETVEHAAVEAPVVPTFGRKQKR